MCLGCKETDFELQSGHLIMEIEAKFIIPDEATFARLSDRADLGGHVLSAAQVKQVHDVYLDTTDQRLLRAGMTCRVRRKDGGAPLLALKSLGVAQGALHSREELETALPAHAGYDPTAWPLSPAQSLLLDLTQGAMLLPLFDLSQQRSVRLLLDDAARALIELSLDRVRYTAQADRVWLGLEAELLAEEARTLLDRIALDLETVWGLSPQPRSKFEQGLALVYPRWTL